MVVGELTQERDLVIIGGGPGGYHAAIRAAQLGQQVTLIEKGELGGVCLNEGCIPSKIHASAAQQFNQLSSMASLGIDTTNTSFQLSTLQQFKKETIRQLKQGIEGLCKANKIEVISGEATFLSSQKIGVESGHQYDTYTFNHAIIAAGVNKMPLIDIKEPPLSATSVWNLDAVPGSIVFYGNNDITLEAAFSFRRLGSDVTIILPGDQLEFTFDAAINKELTRQMKKQKIKAIKSKKILHAHKSEAGWDIEIENVSGEIETFKSEHFYAAAVNVLNDEKLGLKRAGIELNKEGLIKIDHTCRTNQPHIYAVGDITEGPALAVKAIKQGKVAAENIAGIPSEYDLTFLPRVVQVIPPIACVGLTEQDAKEQGYDITIGESSLKSSGYASIFGQKDGIIKTISEKESELLLGVHMIGAGAMELITSSTFALEMVAREEDLLFPLYPHPSINESMLEAAEDLSARAIHKPPSKQKQKISINS